MLKACFALLLLPIPANGQPRAEAARPPASRAEQERFLLTARIAADPAAALGAKQAARVRLDDGTFTHLAAAETATSPERDYRGNVAAYELDKALALDLVVPSVERSVDGRPASLTWWVEDILMSEVSRRARRVEPPDPELWGQQLQAVRVFDELVANAYRDARPEAHASTTWDNLLITRDWRIWLIDHRRAFGTSHRLALPETLTRCDRTLLVKLRELNPDALKRRLGTWLTPAQLDALDARRVRIAQHFDERIARDGEPAVLYDLPRRP
jgi:hypothetical protein